MRLQSYEQAWVEMSKRSHGSEHEALRLRDELAETLRRSQAQGRDVGFFETECKGQVASAHSQARAEVEISRSEVLRLQSGMRELQDEAAQWRRSAQEIQVEASGFARAKEREPREPPSSSVIRGVQKARRWLLSLIHI